MFLLVDDANGNSVAKDCECRINRITENKLKFATIPLKYKNCYLADFSVDIYQEQRSREVASYALNQIASYMDKLEDKLLRGKGMYLFSEQYGSGKTRLAISLGNELIRMGKRVRFTTIPQLLGEIRKTFNKDKDGNTTCTESKLMEEIKDIDILILDDLGVERKTDFANEKVFELINGRYLGDKATIFTSNFYVDNLPCDGRTKSRIKEMVELVAMPEESVRDAIFEENNG